MCCFDGGDGGDGGDGDGDGDVDDVDVACRGGFLLVWFLEMMMMLVLLFG